MHGNGKKILGILVMIVGLVLMGLGVYLGAIGLYNLYFGGAGVNPQGWGKGTSLFWILLIVGLIIFFGFGIMAYGHEYIYIKS